MDVESFSTKLSLTSRDPTTIKPKKWVKEFKNAGCDLYCFHYEAAFSSDAESPEAKSADTTNPRDLVRYIHDQGLLAGVAIKPATGPEVLYELLDSADARDRPDVSLILFYLHFLIFLSILAYHLHLFRPPSPFHPWPSPEQYLNYYYYYHFSNLRNRGEKNRWP